MRTRLPSARKGFSLLELLFALVTLGTFLGTMVMVLGQGSSAARTGMVRQSVEGLARRTLDHIAADLMSAVTSTLDPVPAAPWGGSTLRFQSIESYSGGEVQWSPVAELALELEDGELADDADNNSNGLIDERKVVYTRTGEDGTPVAVTLAHGVCEYLQGEVLNGADDNGNGLKDEAGLSFVLTGGRLVLRLSLEERDLDGHLHVHTVQTSVRLRN